MKKLNILDLHRSINEKKDRMTASFEKVLDLSHRKITSSANQKKLHCYFEVPSFLFGYPLYKLNECVDFVQKMLKSNGFLVEYYFPNILYISWDFDEIDNTKKMSSLKAPLASTTKALAPIAPKNSGILKYKPSGKLELNLL